MLPCLCLIYASSVLGFFCDKRREVLEEERLEEIFSTQKLAKIIVNDVST